MADEKRIRCGDVVLHRPTGERWLVAYADYERGDLAWSGWPEGIARIDDCDLVESCSDQWHQQRVADWADKDHGSDHRAGVVRRLYRHPAPDREGSDE